ncbi:hypothetical protein [Corynebacterium nasicanis]|uniref:Secreted protein n=1 Tax=Corynebacterium nasicanis TaxID=1448267 RepID=A0ABW1Q8H8_9CORY
MIKSRRIIAATAALTFAASAFLSPVASAQDRCNNECERQSSEAAVPLLVLGGLALSSHGPVGDQLAAVNTQVQQSLGIFNKQLADTAAQFAGPVAHVGGALLVGSAIVGSSQDSGCQNECGPR